MLRSSLRTYGELKEELDLINTVWLKTFITNLKQAVLNQVRLHHTFSELVMDAVSCGTTLAGANDYKKKRWCKQPIQRNIHIILDLNIWYHVCSQPEFRLLRPLPLGLKCRVSCL